MEEVLCVCHNGAHQEVSKIDETDEKGKLARLAVNRIKLAMASFSITFTTGNEYHLRCQHGELTR
jgi:hypothetical protein